MTAKTKEPSTTHTAVSGIAQIRRERIGKLLQNKLAEVRIVVSGRAPDRVVVVDDEGRQIGVYRQSKGQARSLAREKAIAIRMQAARRATPAVQAEAKSEKPSLLPPVDPARRAKTLEEARARGAIIADDIMTRADMITGEELADEFDMTRQAIDKRFRKGQLLGLTSAKRGRKYPTAQFDRNGKLLPGIADVLSHFNGDAWSAWRFLAAEHIELKNLTGFLALRNGMVDDVKSLLTAMDHGAFS